MRGPAFDSQFFPIPRTLLGRPVLGATLALGHFEHTFKIKSPQVVDSIR